MLQVEAYVGGGANLVRDRGSLASESARAFVITFLAAFAAWLDKLAGA
jgi:hypothetical protein